MPIRHLFVLLLLLPLFWGCEKEPLAPGDAAPGSGLIGERSGKGENADSKFGAYAISNREVGDFYTDEVNARLGPFPFPSIFNRQLISTFVVPLALAGETGLDVPAFRQEHVTWHFYAAVLRFVFEEELCCPALL